jgi:alpha-ketoglutarate-dependent 2,4-dichlorophenoxyacetate dioxygenase
MSMAALNVSPTAATIGAEISGVDLRLVDDVQWREIESLFNAHGVLIFPGQKLSQEDQVNFALRFGNLEMRDSDPTIKELSNLDKDGNLADISNPRVRKLMHTQSWHIDSSWAPKEARASVLAAIELPKKGGQTEFADMAAAYDKLSDYRRQQIEKLEAWHSNIYDQAAHGLIDVDVPSDPTALPGARHAIVRAHPFTQRRSLFIGAHACYVFGMSVEDGQKLLADLVANACQKPRVYSHTWRAGDVVVWDNRRVLHRVQPWNPTERRVMRHVRTVFRESETLPAGI